MVLVSSFLLILISVYRNRKNENQADTFRRLWATGVVAFLLSALADFAPTIAGPFAMLTVLGWFVKDGTQLVDNALGGTGVAAAKPVGSTTTRTNSTGGTTTQTGP